MTDQHDRHYQILAAFNSMDRNRDGFLTRQEFMDALRRVDNAPQPNVQNSNPQVEALFDSMDVDRDGQLSRAEFDELLRTLGQMARVPPRPPMPQSFPMPVPVMKTVDVPVPVAPVVRINPNYVSLLLTIGIVLMFLITLLPMWVASFLLNDATYMFFAKKQSVWGMVLCGMLIAICILISGLVDAAQAFRHCPCCCCLRRRGVELPDLGDLGDLEDMPGLPRCNDGVFNVPFLGRVKTESVVVACIAIFLVLSWSLLPSGHMHLPGWLRVFLLPFEMIWLAVSLSIGVVLSGFFAALNWHTLVNGANAATGIVIAIWCTYICYGATLWLFFKSRHSHRLHGAPALACVWATYILVLGFLLLGFAACIRTDAVMTYNEIFIECASGKNTAEVYKTSQTLQALRLDATCQLQPTVKDCVGYEDYGETKAGLYLYAMEHQHRCQGFCYNAATMPTSINDTQMIVNITGPLPATATALYSEMAYRRTCEAAAARSMDTVVAGAGTQIHYAGIFFIVVALSVVVVRGLDKRLDLMASINSGETPRNAYSPRQAYGSMDRGRAA